MNTAQQIALNALLKQAAQIVQTPEEVEEDLRSCVRGQLGMMYPEMSAEEVRRIVDQHLDGGKGQ